MNSNGWTPKDKIDDAEVKKLDAKGEFGGIYRTLAILATVQNQIQTICNAADAQIASGRGRPLKPLIPPNSTIAHTCKSPYGHNVEIKVYVCDNNRFTTHIAINGELCQIRMASGGTETRGGKYVLANHKGLFTYRTV